MSPNDPDSIPALPSATIVLVREGESDPEILMVQTQSWRRISATAMRFRAVLSILTTSLRHTRFATGRTAEGADHRARRGERLVWIITAQRSVNYLKRPVFYWRATHAGTGHFPVNRSPSRCYVHLREPTRQWRLTVGRTIADSNELWYSVRRPELLQFLGDAGATSQATGQRAFFSPRYRQVRMRNTMAMN